VFHRQVRERHKSASVQPEEDGRQDEERAVSRLRGGLEGALEFLWMSRLEHVKLHV
jgi:hypothetical protein